MFNQLCMASAIPLRSKTGTPLFDQQPATNYANTLISTGPFSWRLTGRRRWTDVLRTGRVTCVPLFPNYFNKVTMVRSNIVMVWFSDQISITSSSFAAVYYFAFLSLPFLPNKHFFSHTSTHVLFHCLWSVWCCLFAHSWRNNYLLITRGFL